MKYFIFILLVILILYPIETISEEASIKINTKEVAETPISKNIFGGFVEFLLDYINGTNGMCAQELRDRGFDMNFRNISSSDEWEVYSTGKGTKAELIKGGYNINGKYFQRLSSTSFISKIGIYQDVYINDTCDYDLYYYAKSYERNKITVSLIDTLFQITYFSSQVISDSIEFKKFKFHIPKFKNVPNRLNLLISTDSISQVDIDEVSLMQSDNVFGVRKEYCDLIEKWKPGIIRYPGGGFADTENSKYIYYIGDIDQRQSPNRIFNVNPNNTKESILVNQRLDFGLHEYLMFCEKLDIEAQISVNVINDDEKAAWNWIEYCIGDSNTPNGKTRTKMGHPKPFKLNYVEIGNENWNNIDSYLVTYVKFYDYIKSRNKDINLIVNANHWVDSSIIKIMNYAKDKVDNISFHPTYYVPDDVKASDEQIFLSSVGCAEAVESQIYKYINWFKDNGYGTKVKQAVSEWWSCYGLFPDYLVDTNRRGSSLEAALWNIIVLNSYLRHPNEIPLSNRTNGIGMIKRGFDKNNKRSIYGAVTLWAESMLSNFHGDMLVNTTLNCKYFDAHEIKELWGVWGAKRLDVTTTKSKDSIYISIINKHPSENVLTSIEIDNNKYYGNAKVYYLNSEKYTDCNTENEPLKVIPRELNTFIKGAYSLPPHSFNIIAIPYSKNSIDTLANERHFYVDNIINSILNLNLAEFPKENSFLRIYNLLGLEVFNSKLSMDQLNFTFWLDELSNGVYFGRINDICFKFIKKVN